MCIVIHLDMFQASSSSDSSEHGERFTNVRSMLVKSKDNERTVDGDYAQKRRLGDLIFDADFEGGNLGHVEQADEFDFDMMLRPDVANPRHRVWFNFKVSNQRPNQCVVFTFVNLSENLSLFNEGFTPVARSTSRPNWQHLDRNQVFYYRSPDHNNRRVLSIAFRFASHGCEYQFAMFYPYTISTLIDFINRWNVELKRRQKLRPVLNTRSFKKHRTTQLGQNIVSDYLDRKSIAGKSKKSLVASNQHANIALKIDVITRSVLSKPIYMLQIIAPESIGARLEVIVMARRCGNLDPAASIVIQGLIDFMLSDDPVASVARGRLNLTIFPMVDPDSSWVGNSRTDLWGQATVDPGIVRANPEIYANYEIMKSQIESICFNARSRSIIIEVKVNSSLIGSRILGSSFANILRMEHHLYLPRLLSRFSESFHLEKCMFSDRPGQFIIESNDLLDCYQLDTSPYGYHRRSLSDKRYETFKRTDYLLQGKALAFSLLELSGPSKSGIPQDVEEILSAFNPKSTDVDDVTLILPETTP